jgi:hypothetical protein
MRWNYFLLFFFLIPSFTYSLNQKECEKIHDKVTPQWEKHQKLIEQFKKADSNEERLSLLQRSLAYCLKALEYCETILNDIAQQSKPERKKSWRVRQKKACEEDKKSLEAEIKELEKAIESLLSNIAFDKAKAVFEESRKTADLAKSKEETFPLDLKNIEEVASNLNEIGTLY